jgi:hypothetical protein
VSCALARAFARSFIGLLIRRIVVAHGPKG